MNSDLLDIKFEADIKREESYLMALAYKLSCCRDDAMDLFQDTWLRIIENYPKYDNRNKFRSWASVIMKNVFINNFRNKKRHGVSVDIDAAYSVSSPDLEITDFTDKYIMKLIGQLPHEMSAVFYLYLQGYTYEEISQRMMIPLGTVKSRIFCIKKRLQSALKPLVK